MTGTDSNAVFPTWSPTDREQLVFLGDDGLYQVNPYSDAPPVRIGERATVFWTAGGTQVRNAERATSLVLIPPEGEPRQIQQPVGVRSILYTPESDIIIASQVSGRTTSLLAYPVDGGEWSVLKQYPYLVFDFTFSPDGERLVYTGRFSVSDDLWLYSLITGRDTPLTLSTENREFRPVWRPSP